MLLCDATCSNCLKPRLGVSIHTAVYFLLFLLRTCIVRTVQTSQRSEESSAETGAAVTQMVQNLLQPLRAEQVVRITMDNNVGEGVDVNSLIGRTAHICYLENPVAAKALVYSIAPYLQ